MTCNDQCSRINDKLAELVDLLWELERSTKSKKITFSLTQLRSHPFGPEPTVLTWGGTGQPPSLVLEIQTVESTI